MKKREYRDYINDILNSIDEILAFVKDITYENLISDKKTIRAIERNLEIIGEAAKNIPEEIKSRHSAVPWNEIIGMRNKIIHEYFGVDYEIVWKTIKERLPELKPKIEEIWSELNKKENFG